jgi:hypothetical protein
MPRKSDCSICRDGSLSQNNLIDPSRRHPDCNREPVLTQTKGTKKFFHEDLAGVYRMKTKFSHNDPSMIINDFYVKRVTAGPPKTNAPLVIDANAPLPGPISSQFFQPIRRWNLQIFYRLRSIQHAQFSQCDLLNVSR